MNNEEIITPPENEQPKGMPLVRTLFDWAELFVFSLSIVMLVLIFIGRHSPVSGTSMIPTLQHGDLLIISNILYTPEQGDIIVFQPECDYNEPYVKRVIATGGQTVDIDFETWTVTVDGEVLEEDYINRVPFKMLDFGNDVYPLYVPEGYVFVMGDNRNGSKDSRDPEVGLVDERLIIGQVKWRLFPFDSIRSFS